MQAYTNFAKVYDIFMDNIPYEEWAEYLDEILKEYHIPNNMVLELGCGTGNMTELLADKGDDMIGVVDSDFCPGIDAVLPFPELNQPRFAFIVKVDRQRVKNHLKAGRHVIVYPCIARLPLPCVQRA